MSKQVDKSLVLRTKHQYGAGLDVHKANVVAGVVSKHQATIKTLKLQKFKRTKRGLGEMCRFLGKYLLSTVVMECTGVYHDVVREALDSFGRWGGVVPTVYSINPSVFKKYAGEIHADGRDAYKLAVLGLSGLARDSYIPRGPLKELRQLTRQSYYFMVDVTREKNRLKKVMDFWGLSLPDLDLGSGWALELANSLVSDDIDGHMCTAFEHAVAGKGGGKAVSLNALERRRDAFEPYFDVVLPSSGVHAMKMCLAAMSMKHAMIDANIDGIEGILNGNEALASAVTRLAAIPGIDEKSAAVLIAEIGNVHRFESDDSYLFYVGCAPAAYDSGTISKKARLSKRVNHFTKRTFFFAGKAACGTVKKESAIKEYARAQLNKHWNAKKLAWMNTGIKIARVVYAILVNGTSYLPFPADKQDSEARVEPREKPVKLTELRRRTRRFKHFLDRFKGKINKEELRRYINRFWNEDGENAG